VNHCGDRFEHDKPMGTCKTVVSTQQWADDSDIDYSNDVLWTFQYKYL